MRCLYTLSVVLYGLGIHLAALFNVKARLWVQGRKRIKESLQQGFSEHKRTAWFHCASLGEFEQGRPVIEAFHDKHPEYSILLTFFSPSGYEIRKNYPLADIITYLPLDTPSKVRRFLEVTKPEVAFFVKYEYWYNFIYQLNKRGIPIYLVSGIFRPRQHFFRWYGGWFRKHLKTINYFFLQNHDSLELLHSLGIHQAAVSGDTRFDRVSTIASGPTSFAALKSYRENKQIMLAGSTWPEDEERLYSLMGKTGDNVRYILAPHEVHEERINDILEKSGLPSVRFSRLGTHPDPAIKLIVVDTIGQLSSMYQYADIAYIGGGFGKGIHNILEAAAFGLPVVFGPNYHKFLEARELIAAKAAFSITTAEELENRTMELLVNGDQLKAAGAVSREYVQSKKGATAFILRQLESDFFHLHA